MKAIILSPGPSLAAFDESRLRECDISCAVNRAATKFACTYWVCGDTPLVEQIQDQVVGTPILVTYDVTADTLNDHKFIWPQAIERWSHIAQSWLHTSVCNWPWTSFTSAIVYAAWRGATQIDVYGADWAGTADFDGVEAGKNRSADRWRQERELFGALQIILGERGITVMRHVAEVVNGCA